MLRVKFRFSISCLMALALLSCSRTADKAPLTDAPSIGVAPILQDTKLPLKPGNSLQRVAPALRVENAPYSLVEYFRLVDNLKTLARQESDDSLGTLAASLYHGFYANSGNYTHTTFLRGPVPGAIVGQGEAPIREAVTNMDSDLHEAVKNVSDLLNESAKSYPWPHALPQLTQGIEVTDQYVNWLVEQLQNVKMSGTLKAVAEQQFKDQYSKYRPKLSSLAQGLESAKHLGEAVTAVNQGLKELGVSLKSADAAKLRQAGALSKQLSSMETAQDTLGILVSVWNMTPQKERGSFQKLNSDLYDFFVNKSDEELECLAHPHCPNPALGIAKLVIFKKLETYGLEKIRDQVDASGKDSLVNTTRTEMVKMLPGIPGLVRDSIVKQTASYFSVMKKVEADVPGFTRSHVTKWATEKFNQPLKGLEATSLVVNLMGKSQIQVSALTPVNAVVSTGADSIGASLSLAQEFLPLDDATQLQSAIVEPIMKVLAVGGFRQSNGKPFPNFLLPLDGLPSQIFELTNIMKEPTTFAVPDSFQANDQFLMDRLNARRTVSVGAQAELLKGLSRQIRFFRDWEQNTYDVSLGKIMIEDLVPEVPKGVIRSSFLPKDVIFAMTLANAGALLQNLILDLSPAFLVLEKGEILWGNHYKEIKGNKVSTVVGMVSIVDGKRDGVVKTADIARYVLALDEFMGATEGMENSGSSLLLAKTDNGRSTLLADLVETRKKLQLLQMGLANYLTYVAQQPDGSLASAFKVGDHLERLVGPQRLEDQTLAIRALVASAKRLELPLFRWSALDIYYGMNKNFFDASRQFYKGDLKTDAKNGARAAELPDVVQALLAGEELAEFMPSDTKAQWDTLSRPWIRALQDF